MGLDRGDWATATKPSPCGPDTETVKRGSTNSSIFCVKEFDPGIKLLNLPQVIVVIRGRRPIPSNLRTGQVRTDKVRSGKVRKGKVGKGDVKTGQVRTGQVGTGPVRTGQLRNVMSSQVWTDQVKTV